MTILSLTDSDIQILIVHPDDRYHRRYLAELMQDTAFCCACLSGNQLEVDEALNLIADRDCLISAYVIDDCDCLSDTLLDDILPYLMAECDNYPPMILLFSRELPPHLFSDEKYAAITRIIRDNQHLHYKIPDEQIFLEVTGFGLGRVRVNGREIDFAGSQLLHELFFYVLENPVFYRDHLLADFWSDSDKDSAIATFHKSRKELNALLGFTYLNRTGNHYELNTDIDLHYDVYEYRELLHRISYNKSTSLIEDYQAAFQLQHHDFLLNTHSARINELRRILRNNQSDICHTLATQAHTSDLAIGLYSQSFRLNPYREDSATAMMQLYLEENMPCDALNVYQVLADNLQAALGIKPGKTATQLKQKAEANCP